MRVNLTLTDLSIAQWSALVERDFAQRTGAYEPQQEVSLRAKVIYGTGKVQILEASVPVVEGMKTGVSMAFKKEQVFIIPSGVTIWVNLRKTYDW